MHFSVVWPALTSWVFVREHPDHDFRPILPIGADHIFPPLAAFSPKKVQAVLMLHDSLASDLRIGLSEQQLARGESSRIGAPGLQSFLSSRD